MNEWNQEAHLRMNNSLKLVGAYKLTEIIGETSRAVELTAGLVYASGASPT